jgi:4-hydroxybutyrate dehydrogenase
VSGLERYAVPSPVLFGAGSVGRLGELISEYGVSRPFVVTDKGLVACGLLERALAGLGGGVGPGAPLVFDAVSANPREEDVLLALEQYRSAGADGIVAVGGGSVIDAAKALRLLSSHGGDLVEYDLLKGGAERICQPMAPLLAVPTTAGTGSEVSRGALIVTRRGDVVRKTVVASPRLVPSIAVLDPELTLELPATLTIGTGFDALCHGVEEHVSPRFHPVVEALALGTVARVKESLPRVLREPSDVDARGEMLLAALMAGAGFEKGLGVVHSLSHAVGALHDLHHGLLNAVLLPHALEFNRAHVRAGTWEKLAAALGLTNANSNAAFEAILYWLRELNEACDVPPRLGALKELSSDREEILARALDDHCHRTNPRPCGVREFEEFWQRSY